MSDLQCMHAAGRRCPISTHAVRPQDDGGRQGSASAIAMTDDCVHVCAGFMDGWLPFSPSSNHQAITRRLPHVASRQQRPASHIHPPTQHKDMQASQPAMTTPPAAPAVAVVAAPLPDPVQLATALLLPGAVQEQVRAWLKEDVPSGFDVGGFVVGERPTVAVLYGKSRGLLCGVPFFDAVFRELGCSVEWHLQEGSDVDPSSSAEGKVVVATVKGGARQVLLGERTALNILTRASGIATQARASVAAARAAGWHGCVAGTRKTTPGFRTVEKYALLVGGAATHRHDLSQMVMLKDNHVWSAGSITGAVQQARSVAGFSMKIEVEARTVAEAFEAAEAGADIVMLDNFDPPGLKEAAQQVKARFPHVTIEASGGITAETLPEYMSPHVDVISRGSLTQGYPCLDFSLKVQRS